ncbi:MAG TPA: hypothetical protein VMU24_07280 [Candidatus Acidoferrales bacterium]|nr:hypothetical protein [Candidatus Acidoferrales bacterium]
MSTSTPASETAATPVWMAQETALLEPQLVAKYGEAQRPRIQRGLKQVSEFWRAEDGSAQDFHEFMLANFAGTQPALDTMFDRFENMLEQYFGHNQEIGREFRTHSDLDNGPIQPYDEIFAGYDPTAHFTDDMFANKLAFVVLLNFPLTTLDERLKDGEHWTRRQWAEARLTKQFSKRVPASVALEIASATSDAERYIAEYNIWMHHLVDDKGARLFPTKMRLLSHWNLRDEIKGDYADTQNGLAKQRTIQQVMERIVTQTIPKSVINNPGVDWNPITNQVVASTVNDGPAKTDEKPVAEREPDARYAVLQNTYKASRKADPYSPSTPTLIARRFDEDREIPEVRVKAMLEQILSSPMVPRAAALISKRLGRPLEPFDIWYNGFRAKSRYSEAELDQIVAKRYPTPQAYQKDIPNLLRQLGFSPQDADAIAANIVVDPARGSGHAMGASFREGHAHLRTRVEKTGMNYKGFNIAVHEMGHNVEQTLSLNRMDYYLLHGVPNTAFTEALAFVFQARDLQLLGLEQADPQAEAMKTLNDFWGTYEIAGVALVDMGVWHWMYDHPNATPAELREATLQIARDIWNKYYAPVFHKRDVVLLAIYSHMIDSLLYLPDYPIGHMIAFQIEEQINKSGSVGPEFERMVKSGSIAPDLWMKNATGKPVSPDAMLEATDRALKQLGA